MAKIKSIKGREILDSRGNPTVEVDLLTEDGLFRSAVPSGASTGAHEAHELRDGDKKRYAGLGVLKAVSNVDKIIASRLMGLDPSQQETIDNMMIKLDGTENKEKLGANAILAVSMAVAKAGAGAKKIPLYSYIGQLGGNKEMTLPVPMVLILEGGKHADGASDFQEFMIMPRKAGTFKEAVRIASEIYQSTGKVLRERGFNTNVGFEGAYGPNLGGNEKALAVIVEGIEQAGYKPGEDVSIAMDCAASEFFRNGKYDLKADGKILDGDELIELYADLCAKYPIFSIEDGLAEDEWDSWTALVKKIGDKIQIVGDDLTVTNVKRLEKAIAQKSINSILIKLNQIGTVTETIKAVNLAKEHGLSAVVSHRSAETDDTFIADLAVGLGTGQIKTGATARGERTAKYNELLRIEEAMGGNASYAQIAK